MAGKNAYPQILEGLPQDGSEITFEQFKNNMASLGFSNHAGQWLSAKRAGVIQLRNENVDGKLITMIKKGIV